MSPILTSEHLCRLLSLGPIRRFIHRTGGKKGIADLYQEWSGISRIYPTMEAAADEIRRRSPETRGHLEGALIDSNYEVSVETRVSDYPVLFWLLNASSEGKLRVFDFGGGIGQAFVNFSRFLPEGLVADWQVQDLPEVVSRSKRCFPEGVPERLRFVTTLEESDQCNVFYSAGALHYWPGSMAELFSALGQKPRHFLMNRSPMASTGKDYFTVQKGVGWAVACRIRNLPGFKQEMESEGYSLVDCWIDPLKSLLFPWMPAFSCAYQGAYFRRD